MHPLSLVFGKHDFSQALSTLLATEDAAFRGLKTLYQQFEEKLIYAENEGMSTNDMKALQHLHDEIERAYGSIGRLIALVDQGLEEVELASSMAWEHSSREGLNGALEQLRRLRGRLPELSRVLEAERQLLATGKLTEAQALQVRALIEQEGQVLLERVPREQDTWKRFRQLLRAIREHYVREPIISEVLNERIIDEYQSDLRPGGLTIKVLIDTQKGAVIPIEAHSHHAHKAALVLNIPERDLSTKTAGHLVGGVVFVQDEDGVKHIAAQFGYCGLMSKCGVKYSAQTMGRAQALFDTYVYASPVDGKKGPVQRVHPEKFALP